MKRRTAFAVFGLIAGCVFTAARAGEATLRSPAPVPRHTINAMDLDVIGQLRKNGSDVTKRTDVEHFLYIPLRRDAEAAAREARAAGYRAGVQTPLGKLSDGTVEKRWSVVSHATVVPSIENVRRARAFFEALARRYGGEYDGWDAAVVK